VHREFKKLVATFWVMRDFLHFLGAWRAYADFRDPTAVSKFNQPLFRYPLLPLIDRHSRFRGNWPLVWVIVRTAAFGIKSLKTQTTKPLSRGKSQWFKPNNSRQIPSYVMYEGHFIQGQPRNWVWWSFDRTDWVSRPFFSISVKSHPWMTRGPVNSPLLDKVCKTKVAPGKLFNLPYPQGINSFSVPRYNTFPRVCWIDHSLPNGSSNFLPFHF